MYSWHKLDAPTKLYAVVTPLRKAASYEPRISTLGIWGDMWLTRGKYGIYVAVRGSYGALTGSTWRLLESGENFCHVKSALYIYCHVSYVAVTWIPSLVLRNTWHYVIIRRQTFWFPNFVLYVAHTRRLYAKVWPRVWPRHNETTSHYISTEAAFNLRCYFTRTLILYECWVGVNKKATASKLDQECSVHLVSCKCDSPIVPLIFLLIIKGEVSPNNNVDCQ